LGSFRVSSEINKEATTAAVRELVDELERYQSEGMTADEYQFLQNAIGQRDALRYETPGSKLGLLSQILRYDLPLDYRTQQRGILRETDRETLNALAGKLIEADKLAMVIVGDIPEIKPELETLGIPIKILDEEGNEVPPE
jgi:zinc protease